MAKMYAREALIGLVVFFLVLVAASAAHAQVPTVKWVGDGTDEHWTSQQLYDGVVRDEIAYGRPGNDVLEGMRGFDDLHGGTGDDILKGGPGSDWVEGGLGNDRLNGGLGPDVMYALDGHRDWIECGSGRDVAVVDRRDRIAPDCEEVAYGGEAR